MFKNAFYLPKESKMCLWEQINGEDFFTEIDWTPYVYLPCKKADAEAYTIYGTPVKRIDFRSYSEYEKFVKKNRDNPKVYENEVKFETQFLAERYHGISDEDTPVPNLKTFYIDIEVAPKEGFPDKLNPEDTIILISVRDSLTGKTVTFGYDEYGKRKYTGKRKNVKYIECDNEELLLKRFLNYMHKYKCDVLSGWNIWDFDLPYIINRCIKLFGEKRGKQWYSKMSPINVVNTWKQKKSDDINIDMGGVTILDYYNVYKWYGKKLERYKLDYVSQKELGVGKLTHSYKDLTEFYKKDWNEFVNYNVIDCERVNDLENKLGYIRLIQALSLLSKAPMKYYNAMTKLIEGAMITHYRRNGLCAPHFYGGHQESFQAAHVKDPQQGMHEWVVDVDITSSYPSHIIALNMSNETFMGKIVKMTEKELITYSRKRNFPEFTWIKEDGDEWKTYKVKGKKLITFNKLFKKGLLSIAPCGSVFSTNKTGVVAEVEKNVFFKRKEVKEKMKELDKKVSEIESSGDPYDKKEIQQKKDRVRELNSLQLALKIFINAFFGILAVPYSRYFNTAIAEAITACGRHTIKQGEVFCNELLNNPTEPLLKIIEEIKNK